MIRYAGRKFHLERQIEELLVASGKPRLAELFAGSGFISYTTTLKADVLSDVDERLLNYHRWLAKNDTTEIVIWLNRRLGDWRGTKEEYDALKAYVFGQEPILSPEYISAWVFYGSVTFGRSFDKSKGPARNERGGKIESDGIPQTCKDLLFVKPESSRIVCRGYEEALKHTSPDTHVLFLDPPYPETNSGYYKEDAWTIERIQGIVDGLLKDGYQMVVTLNLPLKGLELAHSVTKTSTKNSYGPIKQFDDLVMTNIKCPTVDFWA